MAKIVLGGCGLAVCGLIAMGPAGGAGALEFTAEATATLLSGGVPAASDQGQVQNTDIFENTDANALASAGGASARARMLWAGQTVDFVTAASSLEDELPFITSFFVGDINGFGLRGGYELAFDVGQESGTTVELEARGVVSQGLTFTRDTNIDLGASIQPLAGTAIPGFELGLTLTDDQGGVVFDWSTDSVTDFEQRVTVPAGSYRVDITAAAKTESDGQQAGSQLGLFDFTVSPFPVGVPDHPLLTGFVGAGKLDLLLGDWNQAVEPGSFTDPSGDGFVGAADLDLLLGVWNAGTPPTGSAAPVPEPGTLGLLALGAAALGRRRR